MKRNVACTLFCIILQVVLQTEVFGSRIGENEATFWIITDLHEDIYYGLNETGDCSTAFQNSNTSLTYEDLDYYGNHNCDSPSSLLESSFDAMKYFHPNPDFILWLGDSISHSFDGIPSLDKKAAYNLIGELLKKIRSRFPKAAIYPALGNHDNKPSQLMPVKNEEFYSGYLKISDWNSLLTEENRRMFLKGGYYSNSIKPGLKLIVLNTILWLRHNYLTENMTDPGDQFQWLDEQLSDSKNHSEKVLIAAHSPPGFSEHLFYLPGPSQSYLHKNFNKKFIDLIVKYGDIISMQFYSHTHSNSFRLYLEEDKPVSSAIISSSVSPNYGVTPSIKHFVMNLNTSVIEKFQIYYMNLTRANHLYAENQTVDVMDLWKYASDSSESKSGFALRNVTTKSLTSLFHQLLKNPKVYQEYKFQNMASYQIGKETQEFLQNACAIKYSRVDDFHHCVEELRGISDQNKIYETLSFKTFVASDQDQKSKKEESNSPLPIILVSILLVGCVFVAIYVVYTSKKKLARYQAV